MKQGQWFMRPTDQPFPKKLVLFEGQVQERVKVGVISKMQALAFIRWRGEELACYRDGNGHWNDVWVTGDFVAWMEGRK